MCKLDVHALDKNAIIFVSFLKTRIFFGRLDFMHIG